MKGHFNFIELVKSYGITGLLIPGFRELKRIIVNNWLLGSYSENGEDLIVAKYFKKKGYYVEIGGYHPIRLSNTYYFYKRGWTGVVAEPNPEIRELFERIRPKDMLCGNGVGAKKSIMTYYRFAIPAINTFNKISAENSIKQGHRIVDQLKIEVIDVNNFVDQWVKKVDYLTIDTEGFDYEILKNWPWEKVKPKVICCEVMDQKNIQGLKEVINNYDVVYQNKVNTIFVLKKSILEDGHKQ